MRVRRPSGSLLETGAVVDGTGAGAGVGTDGAVVIVVVAIRGFLSGQRRLRWPCVMTTRDYDPDANFFA